jgi:hypothetical protein
LRGWGVEGGGGGVREGIGEGGEMTQALYAHMDKKKKNLHPLYLSLPSS